MGRPAVLGRTAVIATVDPGLGYRVQHGVRVCGLVGTSARKTKALLGSPVPSPQRTRGLAVPSRGCLLAPLLVI